jgi:uncharacterized protein YyaL (SSP411 family)
MVLKTQREMAKGGMKDQLGGGFHRYSVDAHWFVPHFEKMLYDQAQLAVSYLEAYQITRDEDLAGVAREIFEYVRRDLSHPDGGFFSAEDADSVVDPAHPHEKGEGAFYIWTRAELVKSLGERDATIFGARYGVRENGNVEEDPHGEFGSRNILYQATTISDVASRYGWTEEDVRKSLARSSETLMKLRARRVRPHLDDKVLTSWNGLMISAFAKGAQILGDENYLSVARKARDFVERHLWKAESRTLLRRFREGESAVDGFLDDYASFALALLDLYETDFHAADLDWAQTLVRRAIELFGDAEHGGFFSSAAAQPDLVLRLKDDYDGAEPSGNSLMALALLRLARMTENEEFGRQADVTLRAFSSRLRSQGTGVPQMLVSHGLACGQPMEIVLAGPNDTGMLKAIRSHFLPTAVVLRAEQALQPMPPVDGKSTAYVCANFACNQPVTSVEALEKLLHS